MQFEYSMDEPDSGCSFKAYHVPLPETYFAVTDFLSKTEINIF